MWRKNSVKVKRRLVPIHSVQRQTRKQQRSDGEISYQTGSELSDKFPTHEHNTTCLTALLHGWLQRANHRGPVQVVSVCRGGGEVEVEVEVEEQRKRRIFTQPAASTSVAETSSGLPGFLESRCSSAQHEPGTQQNRTEHTT